MVLLEDHAPLPQRSRQVTHRDMHKIMPQICMRAWNQVTAWDLHAKEEEVHLFSTRTHRRQGDQEFGTTHGCSCLCLMYRIVPYIVPLHLSLPVLYINQDTPTCKRASSYKFMAESGEFWWENRYFPSF